MQAILTSLKLWLNNAHQTLLSAPCSLCHFPCAPQRSVCASCSNALPIALYYKPDPSYTVLYAFHYATPISDLILKIKFAHSLTDTALLGQLTAEYLAPRIIDKPEVIIPVPLHPQRLQERGFNQALELAKPLGKLLERPVTTKYLKRTVATQAQSSLNAQQRQQNVQQAFAIKQAIPYRHVALFDDVITTGATLGAIKQLLQTHGVERVDFYAVARPLY